MQKFLLVRDDSLADIDEGLPSCKNLININLIHHVFMSCPDEIAIHIEYFNTKANKVCRCIENFDTERECHIRFHEIAKILIGEA